jgi:putative transposase
LSVEERRRLIESGSDRLSIRRQCELLDLHRSNYYYEPVKTSAEALWIMRRIDEIFTECPFYGSRKIREGLRREGFEIGRERVQSLMRQMGLGAIYPRVKASRKHLQHKIYPYLPGDTKIDSPEQVWGTDITYIRLRQGVLYLV